MVNILDTRIEILLREYETLRRESLDSVSNRSQIVSFGLATIGVIAGGILTIEPNHRPSSLVFFVCALGIPAVSLLVLYIWLAEVERMMRAGIYLQDLEARINALVDPVSPTLSWETWLRSTGKQMRYPYLVVIMLFIGLASAGPIVGLLAVGAAWVEHPWVAAALIPTGVVFLHVQARVRKFK